MNDTAHSRPIATVLALCGVLAAIDIVGPLLPDSEGEIAFGVVAAALVIVIAVGLSQGRRWAVTAGLVVAALHVLMDAPAIAVVDTTLLKVLAGVAVAVSVALIVLLVQARGRGGIASSQPR
jgi:hypothetical protein